MSLAEISLVKQTLVSLGMTPGLIEQTAEEIHGLLASSNRVYHGFAHVQAMLEYYAMVFGDKYADEDDVFMAMAIICHDLYWRAGVGGDLCETTSANMCRAMMDNCGRGREMRSVNHAPTTVTDMMCQAIKGTAKYMGGAVGGGPFGARLCDLDLASLAEEFDVFESDGEDIITEAGYEDMDEGRKARAGFLATLVGKREGMLFRTQEGREAWNPQALRNIERYIKEFG